MPLPHVISVTHRFGSEEEEVEDLLLPEAVRLLAALGREVVGADTSHAGELFLLYEGEALTPVLETTVAWVLDPSADPPSLTWEATETSLHATIPLDGKVLHLALHKEHPHQVDWWVTEEKEETVDD